MFAHAEVQVASGSAPAAAVGALFVSVFRRRRIEIAQAFQGRFRRRVEVGRTAGQRRQSGRYGVHHLAGSLARRKTLVIGVKYRDVRIPARRQFGTQASLQFFGQIRKRPGVGIKRRVPCGLVLCAAHQIVRMQGSHGLKHLGLLTVYGAIALIRRRFHGQQRDDLEQVVLDNVTQAAGAFVKRAAPFHAEIL
jgi:hypothetical protein